MPEKTGTVTGFITNPKKGDEIFGLHIDGSEFVYSFPDYRGEPFEDDKVWVGCEVRVEYQDVTKAGKTKSYISVLEIETLEAPEQPPTPPIPGEPGQPAATTEWGYRQRDRLMCRESCAKSATTIFAASIQAGIYKTHPDVTAVTAFAGALEKWCLEALD